MPEQEFARSNPGGGGATPQPTVAHELKNPNQQKDQKKEREQDREEGKRRERDTGWGEIQQNIL